MVEVAFRELMIMATDAEVLWGVLPVGITLPVITCRLIGEETQLSQDGPNEFIKVVVQVDVWSSDVSEAIAVAEKVRRLNGYDADLNVISNIIMNSYRSAIDETDPNNILYRRMFEFDVFYHSDPDQSGESDYIHSELINRLNQLDALVSSMNQVTTFVAENTNIDNNKIILADS